LRTDYPHSTESLACLLGEYARRADAWLREKLVPPRTPAPLAEAMRYCVLNGGKRLRPSLVMMTAEALGARVGDELVQRSAAAVELVHCYSLVHDDLPSMDDDDLRRGQPTCHVKFGQAMAILAGDALLTRAFEVLAESGRPAACRAAAELARGAGSEGMVAGQVADMDLCDLPPGREGLDYIHVHKTADLLRAAARMGAICASADTDQLAAVSEYAESLGMAFQLVDDILDATGRAEALGKTPGKDRAAGKRTHLAELEIDECRVIVAELTARASRAVAPLGAPAGKLRALVELLAKRTY
jgi:geranylgeranyl pyrophosphate synthase